MSEDPVGAAQVSSSQDPLSAESARLLLQSVKGYAIYLLDPGGHVTSWNPGAQAIKGYAAEEVLGQHFSRFYTPEDRASGAPERELLAATNGMHETEGWRVRKDGQRFWANVTLTPLYSESGALRGFAKVTRDMTEQRRAQLQRIRMERAEEALQLRDEFLAQASQSLNSTLTSLRMHIATLKSTVGNLQGSSPQQVAAKLTTLERGLDRLTRSTEQVLRTATEASERLLRNLQERVR
ncbi:MAG TPA: PAS domain-containing protein [Aggregicoccus sp.]|nr:PAS domain-containing protein [Aggregicoccus sp.]